MPVEMQRELRKGKTKENAHSVYKSRLRPNLREYLDQNNIRLSSSKSDIQ